MKKPKKFSIFVVNDPKVVWTRESDDLAEEMIDGLQDALSGFECAITDFHKKHGFEPPEENSAENEKYWSLQIREADEARAILVKEIVSYLGTL